MNEPYQPEVNDYVIWDKGQYGIDEGCIIEAKLLTVILTVSLKGELLISHKSRGRGHRLAK